MKTVGNWEMVHYRLQEKLSEIMQTQHLRWMYEKRKQPSVETLREWIIMK